jgi:RNA polymerase sigma-70 factor (ECF subfamily)
MREVQDMDTDEIADCLGISLENVKVRIHRAKSMLKDVLYNITSGTEILEFGNKRCDNLVALVMSKLN